MSSSPANNRQTSQAVKKSLLFSGLVGTAGFFIAKAIGLIYTIPFASILGSDAYMNYYGSAYRIYSYILNIFSAGFPFAVATMVAKYETMKNYKTILEVKRLAIAFMALIGFLGMVVMMALSAVIAPVMVQNETGVHTMMMVLCILAIAIFFVPILSAYRGFIQGMREMQEYAFSQAFEQLFRVGFLLSVSCLMVYVLGMARVWALYASVLSTSVAAIAGLIQIRGFASRSTKQIEDLAREQKNPMLARNPLMKEFVLLAVPYMISAILGYSDDIFNTILLPIGLKANPQTANQINVIMSGANYVGLKLNSIPMVLAPGFTAAIIPHISADLMEKNYEGIRRNIQECLNIVLFIALLLCFGIMLYAKPLLCMFYTENLDVSASVVRWNALEGFLGTLTPVISSIMMALRLQKSLLKRLVVSCLIKGILIVPFAMFLGFPGSVLATVVSYGYIIVFNCLELNIRYKIHFGEVLFLGLKTAAGLLCMGLCGWTLMQLGLGAAQGSKLMIFIGFCFNGLISVAVFAGVEFLFRVPQKLFHLSLGSLH